MLRIKKIEAYEFYMNDSGGSHNGMKKDRCPQSLQKKTASKMGAVFEKFNNII